MQTAQITQNGQLSAIWTELDLTSSEVSRIISHITHNTKPAQPLIIFGANANDIIKVLTKPGDTHKWDNDYFELVCDAIEKLNDKLKTV